MTLKEIILQALRGTTGGVLGEVYPMLLGRHNDIIDALNELRDGNMELVAPKLIRENVIAAIEGGALDVFFEEGDVIKEETLLEAARAVFIYGMGVDPSTELYLALKRLQKAIEREEAK